MFCNGMNIHASRVTVHALDTRKRNTTTTRARGMAVIIIVVGRDET